MKIISFFNNKGGVGKTTIAYHVAHMMGRLGKKVLVMDLDPQANITALFLNDSKLEEIYGLETERNTIIKSLLPIQKGTGDIDQAETEQINNNISLISGDLELSILEDKLSQEWANCADGKEPAFRMVSSFYRIAMQASEKVDADYVLFDVGPNFGAINRAALISSDYIVIPMAADLFSLLGLKNLGRMLDNWKNDWETRYQQSKSKGFDFKIPEGNMQPIGYIVSQHSIRDSRPVKSYQKWANKIPKIYDHSLKNQFDSSKTIENDPNCLALLKHYRSLMPLSMQESKPIFDLKPADGAFGSHVASVINAKKDFERLTKKIIEKTQRTIP